MPKNIKAKLIAIRDHPATPLAVGTVLGIGVAIAGTLYFRKNSNAYIAYLDDIRDQYDKAFAVTIEHVRTALHPE